MKESNIFIQKNSLKSYRRTNKENIPHMVAELFVSSQLDDYSDNYLFHIIQDLATESIQNHNHLVELESTLNDSIREYGRCNFVALKLKSSLYSMIKLINSKSDNPYIIVFEPLFSLDFLTLCSYLSDMEIKRPSEDSQILSGDYRATILKLLDSDGFNLIGLLKKASVINTLHYIDDDDTARKNYLIKCKSNFRTDLMSINSKCISTFEKTLISPLGYSYEHIIIQLSNLFDLASSYNL